MVNFDEYDYYDFEITNQIFSVIGKILVAVILIIVTALIIIISRTK